jgi:hypothetical protein
VTYIFLIYSPPVGGVLRLIFQEIPGEMISPTEDNSLEIGISS